MLRRSPISLRVTAVGAILLGGLGTAGAMALSHSAPPSPRIVSGPGHRTARRTAAFSFTDAGHGLRFRCSINGRHFRLCHSPVHFAGLPLGANSFRVEARTRSGATSAWVRYAWTIRPLPAGLAVSAPLASRSYNAAGWATSCSAGGGVCGTLRTGNGRPHVVLAIRQLASGRYWNGHRYAARQPVWARTSLRRAHAGHRAWVYRLAMPHRDGAYRVTVRSFSRFRIRIHGHRRTVAGQRARQAVQFAIDTVAPAAPSILSGPASPTTAATAAVRFTDTSAGVLFACSLDGAPATACSSPAAYSGLAPGVHRFSVTAIDEAGNRSAPATVTWQQTSTGGSPAQFTISAQTGGPLYPGAAPQTVALTLGNPNADTIYVTSVGVTLEVSRLPAGCPAGGFALQEPVLPAGGVAVPARSTVVLPTPSKGAASIQMVDTGSNQDACQNAALALQLAGAAHS